MMLKTFPSMGVKTLARFVAYWIIWKEERT
jgi:hypothetical protein